MIAIELNDENLDAIVTDNRVLQRDVEEMNAPEARNPGQTLYFIPNFRDPETDYEGWCVMTSDTLGAMFTYDIDKIQTQFVELTRR